MFAEVEAERDRETLNLEPRTLNFEQPNIKNKNFGFTGLYQA